MLQTKEGFVLFSGKDDMTSTFSHRYPDASNNLKPGLIRNGMWVASSQSLDLLMMAAD
jgi:hypothetical protein